MPSIVTLAVAGTATTIVAVAQSPAAKAPPRLFEYDDRAAQIDQTSRLVTLAGLGAGAGAVVALAQLPPTRNLLLKLKDPGEGPSEEQRERSWFRVRMVAQADGKRVVTEVSGGDPGYGETSKMLSESALCLAHDELPDAQAFQTPGRTTWR